MFLTEFLRVTSLSISYIDLAGLSIIDDVGPQDSNLRHAFFCRFDLCRQFVMVGCSRCRFFLQHCIFQQIMLGKKIHRLRHLFEIKDLGPTRIPSTFSSTEFFLDVHQQINLGRLRLYSGFFTGCVLLFPCQYRTNFCLTISGSQSFIHPGNIFPSGSLEANCFSAPGYFAAHLGKHFQ